MSWIRKVRHFLLYMHINIALFCFLLFSSGCHLSYREFRKVAAINYTFYRLYQLQTIFRFTLNTTDDFLRFNIDNGGELDRKLRHVHTVSFSLAFYIVLRPQGIRKQMKTLRKRFRECRFRSVFICFLTP